MVRILLGVSGGIAAYKAVEFARLAIRAGYGVRVVATANSAQFVGTATFQGITGAPVLSGEFEQDPLRGAWPGQLAPDHVPIGHLALAEQADAMLVAPASANTLAKLAHGFCDSALTTAFCATQAPRVIAPAMNGAMWEDAATQANITTLEARGVTVASPEHGDLASLGEYGAGRLAEPAGLLSIVESALAERENFAVSPPNGPSLSGAQVLVTAGGTREPLDPVRFIGNRSSGRMGYAIATVAARRGADVTLISANSSFPAPPGVRIMEVETTAELAKACKDEFPACDMLFMAAAPADFRPRVPASDKISRNGTMNLDLEATEDILASLAPARRSDQTLVGFAAETGKGGEERALAKLDRKAVDLIVLNDVSNSEIGFDSDQNEVTVFGRTSTHEIGRRPKAEVASELLDLAAALNR